MIEWVRSHPYAAALASMCILVVIGTFIVHSSTATPASSGIVAWTGNTAILTPATAPVASNASIPTTNTESYATITLPKIDPASNENTATQPAATSSSSDLAALLSELSQKAPQTDTAATSTSTNTASTNAWSYVPTGLISITATSSGRSASEQALYTYGNEAGSYIEGYDAENSNQTQVLVGAQNDRQNPAKSAAVETIGENLETVGDGLAQITDVPAAAQADNTALSASYIDIGKKLIAVAEAEPMQDSALVAAIEAYDNAVNSFNEKYIALSTMFLSAGVTFSPSDPGSVFTFSSSSL